MYCLWLLLFDKINPESRGRKLPILECSGLCFPDLGLRNLLHMSQLLLHQSSISHCLAKIIVHFPCPHVDVSLQPKAIIAPDDMHVGITNPDKSLQMN